jgi:hypothetical protein
MSLKKLRDGPTTADDGHGKDAEHVSIINLRALLEGMSTTAHQADPETGSDSELEWKKNAQGFKMKRIGSKEWTVRSIL